MVDGPRSPGSILPVVSVPRDFRCSSESLALAAKFTSRASLPRVGAVDAITGDCLGKEEVMDRAGGSTSMQGSAGLFDEVCGTRILGVE